MAFPTPGVLDNFNRTNETPLSTGWTEPIVNGQSSPNLASNVVVGVGTKSSAYWNANQFGPGIVDVYLDVNTKPGSGNYIALWAMVQNPNSATLLNGYFLQAVQLAGTDTLTLVRMDNNVESANLVVVNQEYAVGDSLGMRILANGNFEIWYKPSAGSWTRLDNSVTDTHYTSGYIGFEIKSTTGKIDNFGGGFEVQVALTGQSGTGQIGTIGPQISLSLTGVSGTGSLGILSPGGASQVPFRTLVGVGL